MCTYVRFDFSGIGIAYPVPGSTVSKKFIVVPGSYCCDLPPFFHNPQSQFPAAEILESINKSYRLPSHPIPGVISTDNGSTVRHQHAVKSSSTEADKVFPIIECSDNLDGSVNRKDYYRNNCSLL